jgi:hypothetical protein
MSGRRSAILGGMLGAALTLAACGGDAGDSAPSPAAYVADADKLCAGFTPKFTKQSEDIRADAPALRQDVAGRRRIYREVRALHPPDALKAKVDAFLAASDAYLATLDEQAGIAAAGDFGAFQEQEARVAQAGARRQRLAAEVGYKRCGQAVAGPALTPAGFLPARVAARADAACKRATDVTIATKPKTTKAADVAATYTTVAPAARTAYRALAKIQVPAANRDDWQAFLDVFDRRVTAIEAIAARADGITAAEYDRLAANDPGAYDREASLTRTLGLTVCGQSTSLGV